MRLNVWRWLGSGHGWEIASPAISGPRALPRGTHGYLTDRRPWACCGLDPWMDARVRAVGGPRAQEYGWWYGQFVLGRKRTAQWI